MGINFKSLDSENKIFEYQGMLPELDPSVFLAPGVKIIGDVKIGKDSSIWYNTVVRGDVHYIKIGELTNIQDLSMLHVTNGKYPLNIGNGVTIGHSVKLHGCTIEDYSLIGIGAIVLDGAVIETNSMVAAGAVVRPNTIVKSGKLYAGVPAKEIRNLTAAEIEEFQNSAKRYRKYVDLTLSSEINTDNK